MKIVLNIMGNTLYQLITKAIASAKSPFPRSGADGKLITWQLLPLAPPFNSDYVENVSSERGNGDLAEAIAFVIRW